MHLSDSIQPFNSSVANAMFKGSHQQHLKSSFSPPVEHTTSATMSSDGESTVAVKLFIAKDKKMVLFAESDQDFVDVLFSFLTLPLGKQSQVGCLDELYKSVENLGEDHFQTKACKTMLLSPRNAAAAHLDRLKVEVDDIDQTVLCLQASHGILQLSP
ncbi:hypothetical protein D1007_41057 [Hordeum vulgare]|nr:hypothetical protein D1007_41057 [Hordeum vulgare]